MATVEGVLADIQECLSCAENGVSAKLFKFFSEELPSMGLLLDRQEQWTIYDYCWRYITLRLVVSEAEHIATEDSLTESDAEHIRNYTEFLCDKETFSTRFCPYFQLKRFRKGKVNFEKHPFHVELDLDDRCPGQGISVCNAWNGYQVIVARAWKIRPNARLSNDDRLVVLEALRAFVQNIL